MLKYRFVFASLAALILVAAPGASKLTVSPAAPQAEPCSPNLTAPPPSPNQPPTPPVPQNLRIIKGGVAEEFFEPGSEMPSGPFAWPEGPAAAPVVPAHDYFNMLVSRPDCMTSFHFRSQANIDLTPSRADGANKIPIRYDSSHDAARFEIDPSGKLPSSGSTGTPQKRLPIHVKGTSLLITWDLKIAASMKFVAPDGLDQHKSHRIDNTDADAWLGMKQNYLKAANRSLGIAEFFFSATQEFMGPGTTRGSSEKINPVAGEYRVQPDTWTRVWVLIEGDIGNAAKTSCQLSVWLADENRAPFQMYNRVNMITPTDGIGIFRYEFDSSQKDASNGPGQQWQRNFVALKGVNRDTVVGLLQRPVR